MALQTVSRVILQFYLCVITTTRVASHTKRYDGIFFLHTNDYLKNVTSSSNNCGSFPVSFAYDSNTLLGAFSKRAH